MSAQPATVRGQLREIQHLRAEHASAEAALLEAKAAIERTQPNTPERSKALARKKEVALELGAVQRRIAAARSGRMEQTGGRRDAVLFVQAAERLLKAETVAMLWKEVEDTKALEP